MSMVTDVQRPRRKDSGRAGPLRGIHPAPSLYTGRGTRQDRHGFAGAPKSAAWIAKRSLPGMWSKNWPIPARALRTGGGRPQLVEQLLAEGTARPRKKQPGTMQEVRKAIKL